MRYEWIKVTHKAKDCGVVKSWTEYKCGNCWKSVGIETLSRCPHCGKPMIPKPIPRAVDVKKIMEN